MGHKQTLAWHGTTCSHSASTVGREHSRAIKGMPRVASPDYVPRKEADIYTFILNSPEENYLATQMVTAVLKSPHGDMCSTGADSTGA